MGEPSVIEIVWTGCSLVLLLLCLTQAWQAYMDYTVKREQAKYLNGSTCAAKTLALYLFVTVVLDGVVVLSWALAGSLSVVRYYVESYSDGLSGLLVPLLFFALVAFAGRVVVRALSRRVVRNL